MKSWQLILLIAVIPAGLALLVGVNNLSRLQDSMRVHHTQAEQVQVMEDQWQRNQEAIRSREAAILAQQEEAAELRSRLEAASTQIESLDARIAVLTNKIDFINSIDYRPPVDVWWEAAVEQEMKQVKAQIAQEDKQIALIKAHLANRLAIHEEQNARIQEMADEAGYWSGSIIPSHVDTVVTQVYPDWGFVVIQAGQEEGVVKGAQLEVMRDGTKVGMVLVTEPLSHESVANIIREAGVPGQFVQVGDRVIKKDRSS